MNVLILLSLLSVPHQPLPAVNGVAVRIPARPPVNNVQAAATPSAAAPSTVIEVIQGVPPASDAQNQTPPIPAKLIAAVRAAVTPLVSTALYKKIAGVAKSLASSSDALLARLGEIYAQSRDDAQFAEGMGQFATGKVEARFAKKAGAALPAAGFLLGAAFYSPNSYPTQVAWTVQTSKSIDSQQMALAAPHVVLVDDWSVVEPQWIQALSYNTVAIIYGPGSEISNGRATGKHGGQFTAAEVVQLRNYLRQSVAAPAFLSVTAGSILGSSKTWVQAFAADGLGRWDGFAVEGLSGFSTLRDTTPADVRQSLGLPAGAPLLIWNWTDDSAVKATLQRARQVWEANASVLGNLQSAGWSGLLLMQQPPQVTSFELGYLVR